MHKVNEEGKLAEEIVEERVTRGGIVREVEVGVVMSADAAERLIAWLEARVTKLNELRAASEGQDS